MMLQKHARFTFSNNKMFITVQVYHRKSSKGPSVYQLNMLNVTLQQDFFAHFGHVDTPLIYFSFHNSISIKYSNNLPVLIEITASVIKNQNPCAGLIVFYHNYVFGSPS